MPDKKMENREGAPSWKGTVFRPPYLLIGAGILMVLAAAGQVMVGSLFKFTPEAAGISGPGRGWLALVGSLAVVLGATLALHEKGIFTRWLAVGYAGATAVALLAFGVLGRSHGGWTQGDSDSTMTVPLTRVRFIDRWQANDFRFRAEVASGLLQKFSDSLDLVLICRLYDPDMPIGDDTHIVVSEAFPIDPGESTESVSVPLDTLSSRLRAGDQVECGLALLPKIAHLNHILAMRNVQDEGGRIVQYAYDDVSAVAGPPPGE